MTGWSRAAWLVSLVSIGCSTESPVGMTPTQTPPDPGGPGMLPMAPVDEPFSFPDGVVGDWTGYFQAFTLPSGSDAIALKMGQNAGGANEIRLVVGAGPPPAPPTDAAAVWPTGSSTMTPNLGLIEGISYIAHLVRWDGRRLRFSVNSNAPWQPWCALQTSYPLGSGHYDCTPGTYGCTIQLSGEGECHALDGSGATFSPFQSDACRPHCACDAAECIAQPIPNEPFDITFDSDTAGSGVGLDQTRTLRLMR